MSSFNKSAMSVNHHSVIFREGNKILLNKEDCIEQYSVVRQSYWENIFTRKSLLYDVYNDRNRYCTKLLNLFVPADFEIKTKDADFTTMRIGFDLKSNKFGIAVEEVPFHEYMYQSFYFLISVEKFPGLNISLWNVIEEEQYENYA